VSAHGGVRGPEAVVEEGCAGGARRGRGRASITRRRGRMVLRKG